MKNTIKPKTLLLIGNGFDIACGYATSYSEFVKNKLFADLIEKGNNLCRHIQSVKEMQNWVDLEVELYNYSQKITRENRININISKEFELEFSALSKALQEYLTSINATKNRIIPPYIENLVRKWGDENEIYTICFNYTKFFNLVGQDYIYKLNKKYKSVHGYVDPLNFKPKNTIVLGIDDSMVVVPEHSFLYKSSNPVLNIMGVEEFISSSEKFIVFGCSLGCTDEWYYKKIFTQKNKIFEVYYYGDHEKYIILHRIRLLSGGNLLDFKSSNELRLIDSSDIGKLIAPSVSDQFISN